MPNFLLQSLKEHRRLYFHNDTWIRASIKDSDDEVASCASTPISLPGMNEVVSSLGADELSDDLLEDYDFEDNVDVIPGMLCSC